MNRKLGMIVAAGLIAGVSFFVAGCEMCCNSSKGSGSMVITDPTTSKTHKATFKYRVECVGSYSEAEGAVRKVSGRLKYQDHGRWKNAAGKDMKVKIRAFIDNVVDTKEAADYVVAAALQGDNYYDFLPAGALEDELFCSKTAPNMAIFRGHYTPRHESRDGEGEHESRDAKVGEHGSRDAKGGEHGSRDAKGGKHGSRNEDDEDREWLDAKGGHESPGADGGVVTVMVLDQGKPGSSGVDRFEILLTGGVFDGYRQRGVVTKGDVTAF